MRLSMPQVTKIGMVVSIGAILVLLLTLAAVLLEPQARLVLNATETPTPTISLATCVPYPMVSTSPPDGETAGATVTPPTEDRVIDLSTRPTSEPRTTVLVYQCNGLRVAYLLDSADDIEKSLPLGPGDRILNINAPGQVTPTP